VNIGLTDITNCIVTPDG